MTTDQRLRDARLRVLLLPNEAVEDAAHEQVGPRRALAAMAEDGRLEACRVYSFQARYNAVGPGWQHELLDVARDFEPDLVVWQHVHDVAVDQTTLTALRQLPSAPRLLYHEGDQFGRLVKRMPRSTRMLLAACDLALLAAGGRLARMARAAGAPRVAAVVSPHDAERFGTPWTPTPDRALDAVMIGNHGRARFPRLMMPGSRDRWRVASALCQELGPRRFALHGRNWEDLDCDRGPLPYADQTRVIRSAWLSVNWDHFPREPKFASDRLAISLAAGVPHVTTNHPGYDQQYPPCEGLLLADSPQEAVELVRWALAQGPDALLRWGEAARRLAEERLEAGVVWPQFIDLAVRELFASRSR